MPPAIKDMEKNFKGRGMLAIETTEADAAIIGMTYSGEIAKPNWRTFRQRLYEAYAVIESKETPYAEEMKL